MTKSFILLLVVFLALGGAVGGVFAGGVAFGKTQGAKIGLPQEATPLRQQFQDQTHRGGLTGVIEKLDGSAVTVNTKQGPLTATLGVDTTVRRFAEVSISDLQPGMRVTLVGQPGVDGTVEARFVLLNPEEAYVFFKSFSSRDSQQWGQSELDASLSGREDQQHGPNPGGFFFGGGQQHGPSSGGGGGGSVGHP